MLLLRFIVILKFNGHNILFLLVIYRPSKVNGHNILLLLVIEPKLKFLSVLVLSVSPRHIDIFYYERCEREAEPTGVCGPLRGPTT